MPSATMALRSRFVAAMILVFTRTLRDAPHPHEGLVVEEAEELGLARQRRLRDLVEEERAAVRAPRRGRAATPTAPVKAPRS